MVVVMVTRLDHHPRHCFWCVWRLFPGRVNWRRKTLPQNKLHFMLTTLKEGGLRKKLLLFGYLLLPLICECIYSDTYMVNLLLYLSFSDNTNSSFPVSKSRQRTNEPVSMNNNGTTGTSDFKWLPGVQPF